MYIYIYTYIYMIMGYKNVNFETNLEHLMKKIIL